jgi:hypothetical protein
MPVVTESATFVLSIDVASDSGAGTTGAVGGLKQTASSLLRRLNELRLSATWALSELSAGVPLDELTSSHGQELALLGRPAWTGPASTRAAFLDEFNRRLTQWAPLRRSLTSLVLSEPLGISPELLVKSGITAIRPPLEPIPAPRSVLGRLAAGIGRAFEAAPILAPKSLRWGLWEVPATLDIARLTPRQARRAVDRAVFHGALIHVAVPLAALVESPVRSRHLERLLEHVARRRDEELLDAIPLSGVALRYGRQRTGPTARSVMRRRAA